MFLLYGLPPLDTECSKDYKYVSVAPKGAPGVLCCLRSRAQTGTMLACRALVQLCGINKERGTGERFELGGMLSKPFYPRSCKRMHMLRVGSRKDQVHEKAAWGHSMSSPVKLLHRYNESRGTEVN